MSRHIPPELIPNILARLPVKDVLRCTSVCKSWYSLVTCSSFTSLHLKLSTPNQKPRVLIQYQTYSTKKQHYITTDRNQPLNEIARVDDLLVPCEFYDIIHPYTDFIDSFNGLILASSYNSHDAIVLWNPSLRKIVILPKPMGLSQYNAQTLGFGFLPATNDYKIVSILYPLDFIYSGNIDGEVKGEIYELSTGSWRDIVSADNIPFIPYSRDGQAFLKDIVHWPAKSRDNDDRYKLIGSFDMKNENFGTLMLPNSLGGLGRFSLSTFQESLCFSYTQDLCCIVWVMKEYGVTDSWAYLFRVDTGCYVNRPCYFTENGEFLLKVAVLWNETPEFRLYDPINKKQIKELCSSAGVYHFITDSYMESLVLLKGSK